MEKLYTQLFELMSQAIVAHGRHPLSKPIAVKKHTAQISEEDLFTLAPYNKRVAKKVAPAVVNTNGDASDSDSYPREASDKENKAVQKKYPQHKDEDNSDEDSDRSSVRKSFNEAAKHLRGKTFKFVTDSGTASKLDPASPSCLRRAKCTLETRDSSACKSPDKDNSEEDTKRICKKERSEEIDDGICCILF